ncbi:MAG: HAD family phosphatase [Planctomycetota bacterium]
MPNAIIFDFDGVIVDSEPLHYQAFVLTGKALGFDFSYEHYLTQFLGFDDREGFKHMLAQAIEAGATPDIDDVEETISDLVSKKRTVFEALAASQTVAVPGTLDLVDAAHAAGLPIAIASGALLADIEQQLGILGRRHCFDIIVAADDAEVAHSKPDPTTYRLAYERLAAQHPDAGLDPATTLAIEDTAAGLASAQGAGLMTLGLSTTGTAESITIADRGIENLEGVTLDTLDEWFGK